MFSRPALRSVLTGLLLAGCVHKIVRSPLEQALEGGSVEDVARELAQVKDVNVSGPSGTPPLALAAARRDPRLLSALLDRGANPNAVDKDGISPLMKAAGAGDLDGVKLLLAKGADVNARAKDGRVALSWAAAPAVFKALLAAGADPKLIEGNMLAGAASSGDLEMIDLILGLGVDIDARTSDGMTAVGWAAYRRKLEAVRLLVSRRADPEAARAGLESHAADWEADAAKDAQLAIDNARFSSVADTYRTLERNCRASAKAYRDAAALLKKAAPAPVSAVPPAAAPPAPPARAFVSDVDRPGPRRPENPDDFALIVGIETYSNDLPPAQFAERDAEAVKNHLLALGYPERNIKSLIGGRASKANLEAYLDDWLPRNVKDDSRVFFYFSGHGAPNPESGQAYLLPWDGNPSFLGKTGYPLKTLYAQLNKLKAAQVVVALDSCFSGAGGRSVLSEGARPLVAKVETSIPNAGKIVLFAASSARQITSTLREQEHGLFTYYFLKGLGGDARDAGGALTPRGLYDYLKPKVQDAASRQNRDQTPVLEGSEQGRSSRIN